MLGEVRTRNRTPGPRAFRSVLARRRLISRRFAERRPEVEGEKSEASPAITCAVKLAVTQPMASGAAGVGIGSSFACHTIEANVTAKIDAVSRLDATSERKRKKTI